MLSLYLSCLVPFLCLVYVFHLKNSLWESVFSTHILLSVLHETARHKKYVESTFSIVFEVSPNTLPQIQSKAHVSNVGAHFNSLATSKNLAIFKNKEQSYTLSLYVLGI